MSIDSLLAELKRRGIRVWTEGGELRYRAPQGAFDDALKAQVVAQKPALIRAIEGARERASVAREHPLTAIAREGALPLSYAQERLLFMQSLDGESAAYNMPLAFRIRGPLDGDRLRAALTALARRQEALRMRFPKTEGAGALAIDPEPRPFLWIEDISQLGDEARAARIDELLRASAAHAFDLTVDAPIHAGLVCLGAQDHLLLLTLHHIVGDGWSLGVLQRELGALYDGGDDALPPLQVQYVDYAAWQRGWLTGSAAIAQQIDYWKRQLAGLPPLLALPTDRPRPPVQTYHGRIERFAMGGERIARLERLCQARGVTAYMALLAVFQLLLARYCGSEDIAVGTPVANRAVRELEPLIGFFTNTLVLRCRVEAGMSFDDLLVAVRETVLAAQDHQDVPFEQIVEQLHPARSLSYSPLFQVMFTMIERGAERLRFAGLEVEPLAIDADVAKFDLTLTVERRGDDADFGVEYNTDLFDAGTMRALGRHYLNLLDAVLATPERALAVLPMLDADESRRMIEAWNDTAQARQDGGPVTEQFRARALAQPEATALVMGARRLSYRETLAEVDALAAQLRARGIGPDDRVGVLMERSPEMVVAMLAILEAGAAYVPIDPDYPVARQALVISDAGLSLVITQADLVALVEGNALQVPTLVPGSAEHAGVMPAEVPAEVKGGAGSRPEDAHLAYMIYTSGSTGTPKGVMVTHGNVRALLQALDQRLLTGDAAGDAAERRQVWLAVTSISFDISVLELLWTLARGHEVVLQPELPATDVATSQRLARLSGAVKPRELGFSIFYFASDQSAEGEDRYRLLMEGARFADANGFEAVWVPERHFHAFGGQYPSPSVAAAAVAAVTRNVQVRAGSVVLPLHHPVRVVEEWSMIDNLSRGRVGIAFASGWHFNDFVFFPDHYERRHQVLRDNLDTVRALWRGESREFIAGNGAPVSIRTRPDPVQPELPVWITAAASPDTFRYAGSIGANVLTHLLGQSLDELAEKIALYRRTRAEHGHDPEAGRVTLMLHTYVGASRTQVIDTVREPFKAYLRSSVNLLRPVAEANGMDPDVDQEVLVEAGFQRYFGSSALFGTPESCLPMIAELERIGVDEAACLLDFGIDPDVVVDGFAHLKRLADLARAERARDRMLARRDYRAPEELIAAHGVSHMQCTPSFLRLMLEREEGRDAIGHLQALLVGGEALPAALAGQIAERVPLPLNMYGPTETTVWSGATRVTDAAPMLGDPFANERFYLLDHNLQPVPVGVPGELYIGGHGVTRGYWSRPSLTAERFLPDAFATEPGARMYRTGDVARWREDGRIEFIGRADHQVKWRGFRIEMGEIESVLESHPQVLQAVAMIRQDGSQPAQLVAYVAAAPQTPAPDEESLREVLRGRLPDYMQPGAIVRVEKMPLTPNGKIDRAALPAPVAAARDEASYSSPRTEIEKTVAGIWSELLGLERIGLNDNFFELGGHSFLLAQMHLRLRGVGRREVTVIDLFRHPTIASLATFLEDGDGGSKATQIRDETRERKSAAQRQREQMKERRRNG
mgnify:CR=1 FL=1